MPTLSLASKEGPTGTNSEMHHCSTGKWTHHFNSHVNGRLLGVEKSRAADRTKSLTASPCQAWPAEGRTGTNIAWTHYFEKGVSLLLHAKHGLQRGSN